MTSMQKIYRSCFPPRPNEKKRHFVEFFILPIPHMNYRFTTSLAQGRVRKHMEDRVIVFESATFSLLGVADGHGDGKAAQSVKAYIGLVAPKVFEQHGIDADSITLLFQKLHMQILLANIFSGTTLSLLIVDHSKQRLWIANVGDSPILRLTDTMWETLSECHNFSSILVTERRRVYEFIQQRDDFKLAGHYLVHMPTQESLNMSRALGDIVFSPPVLYQPFVSEIQVTNSTFLIASDGFADVIEPNTLFDLYVHQKLCTAEELQEFRMEKYSQHDNSSLVVVNVMGALSQ